MAAGLIGLAGCWALTGCGSRSAPREIHPEWVIQSRLTFTAEDQRTPSAPLPLDSFRLSFSYISGDLYGPPTTADFIHPAIRPDYTFEMDLNRTHGDLLRSLQPTEFTQEYLKIEPADARIARLAPQALQCDGIEQIATVDWVDARSNERVMLVYVDRPLRITGALRRGDHTIQYNIRAGAAGYIWVARRETDTGVQMYTEIRRPE